MEKYGSWGNWGIYGSFGSRVKYRGNMEGVGKCGERRGELCWGVGEVW